jgi:hypothetical protein
LKEKRGREREKRKREREKEGKPCEREGNENKAKNGENLKYFVKYFLSLCGDKSYFGGERGRYHDFYIPNIILQTERLILVQVGTVEGRETEREHLCVFSVMNRELSMGSAKIERDFKGFSTQETLTSTNKEFAPFHVS